MIAIKRERQEWRYQKVRQLFNVRLACWVVRYSCFPLATRLTGVSFVVVLTGSRVVRAAVSVESLGGASDFLDFDLTEETGRLGFLMVDLVDRPEFPKVPLAADCGKTCG
ncbi:unnamed protein product [Peronospora belbahrii]|uniref:Uncharacterized protein n=1 Tax=Peronospora belbahrii TaxID=622444 RepID=A0AAU9KST4_9STRA|nr:unnamed protein product [Peronospora belbahrii]